MQAADLVKAGDLSGARKLLLDAVKAAPADPVKRFELAELLLVTGEWERADNHFDLVSNQDVSWATAVALLRQLIRAEVTRREVMEKGASPELTTDPTPEVEAALRILVELRQGGDAGELRAEADAAAPEVAGVLNGTPFVGLRDLDDRTADVLEVLTSTGKYFWIPFTQIQGLELHPPKRLRDLVWRPADLDVADGPSGVVYIPAIYVAAAEEQNDALRMGRESDWIEDKGLTRGVGQRCFMIGEDVVALSEIETLTINPGQG
ncbi:MAG: type VI secretion system accessory protein TagJ [Caulobacteraceae bacterium]